MIVGMKLVTEAPLWLMIFCIAVGASLALILYYKNHRSAFSPLLSKWLALVRFVTVTIIAFLLLNPLIKRFTRDREMPLLVIAMDNSASMLIHSNNALEDIAQFRNIREKLENQLSDNFDVNLYTFGEQVSDTSTTDFSEKETDISALFTTIENRYAGRNLGAMVMITDGKYNKGFSPLSYIDRTDFPLYHILCGDTTPKRDLLLAEVNYNRIAYKGNSFPVEVVVRATGADGLKSRLVIRDRDKVYYNQPFDVTGQQFAKIFKVMLQADQEGIRDYSIRVEPVEQEITLVNNYTRAFVEVLSSKKRILLLGAKPHPDLSAIHNALLSNDQIESEVLIFDQYSAAAQPWDMVVLHQLPQDQKSIELYQRLLEQRTPMLLIGGGNTRTEILSATGTAPNIQQKGKEYNEATGALNNGFALFAPNTLFTDQLPELPPLYVPFGRPTPLAGEQSMIFQKIGRVATNYPLISFNTTNGIRTCFVGGEGLWRWRIFSFRNSNAHTPFDTFINQIIQYLTAADDRSRFRVNANGFFNENESVMMNAELYDAAFNPVTDPEVSIKIESTEQMQYDFAFSRHQNHYSLNAGRLPVGEYRYQANTTLGNERFSANGKFVVAPLNLESAVTKANHTLLKTLSAQTDGLAVEKDEIDDLIAHLNTRDDIKPISHLREKFTDLTSLYWLLTLLILLLSAEWFVRKREGGY